MIVDPTAAQIWYGRSVCANYCFIFVFSSIFPIHCFEHAWRIFVLTVIDVCPQFPHEHNPPPHGPSPRLTPPHPTHPKYPIIEIVSNPKGISLNRRLLVSIWYWIIYPYLRLASSPLTIPWSNNSRIKFYFYFLKELSLLWQELKAIDISLLWCLLKLAAVAWLCFWMKCGRA